MARYVAKGIEGMKKNLITGFIMVLLIGCSISSFSQNAKSVRAELDSAIVLTNIGRYQEADEKYRYVLKNLKSLPSDLTFYFGKNSYMMGQFSQSVDWLNKYIQLKGPSGQYYEEALSWQRKAELEVLKERAQQSVEAKTILSRNYDIDCGPTGKVTCPVCNGSTVVVKKTYLGDQYKTCTYCKQLGYLSCEDFNKVLRGEFKANP
jgi:tetratricopeptide (TPR) repeat protein